MIVDLDETEPGVWQAPGMGRCPLPLEQRRARVTQPVTKTGYLFQEWDSLRNNATSQTAATLLAGRNP